ncbi:serine hydrolase [Fulvivirga imtechensis]|nr:serine hydrolase [Fulvivirga imtechensis]
MKNWMPKIWTIMSLTLLHCSPEMMSVKEDESLLENLMKTHPDQFQDILKNKDKYEVQIIYTQINRDSNNAPSFQSFYYNFDPDRYFYPASTVKMPVAFMALEKLNKMKVPGVDKYAAMLTDSAYSGQTAVLKDSTAATGLPAIAHYIKKLFIVSDNDAYNRLYEFVGQQEVNNKLKAKGYDDSRIIHRLSIFLNEEENRHTNPVRFVAGDSTLHEQLMVRNPDPLPLKGEVLKGKGYISGEELVESPMEFTHKNFIPLDELQLMLRAVVFPGYKDQQHTFDLTEEDYQFLYQYMSQLPSETTWPQYPSEEYYDAYSKFLMYGNDKAAIPKHIRIFNKIGQAYGYMIDNAYIVDNKNKVEFMLSAVIHTNENEIYNDGQYEYEQVAFPFMKNLGQLIYQYELNRKRLFHPDFSRFMVNYDKVLKVSETLHPNLYQNYQHYHVPALDYRRIKRKDIEPFIEKSKSLPGFEVSKLGESVEGREINLVKAGEGATKVLLWSQMHGDESTATRALFEIFNFLASDDALNVFKDKILKETTLYIIPMLNPDGAEVFKRRNALSIDLNRDALRLISPEARILKETRDKYEPEFGFNLHDQSKHYNAYRTGKTASISFLAPAYNYEKEVNEGRGKAMKLIVSMNDVLQEYIPGRIGRYDDAFEPRAFGDNMQKWGTNTILIESGGYPGDPEKKELVKMNFVAILHALSEIAESRYQNMPLNAYYRIPENDRKFYDLLVRNGQVFRNGKYYTMDIGIFNSERTQEGETYHQSSIDDMGDLSTFYGYEELDAGGMKIIPGEIYPPVVEVSAITEERAREWLQAGYTAVKVKQIPDAKISATLPISIVPAAQDILVAPDLGQEANFLISKGDVVRYAVINGRVIELFDE